MGRLLLIGAALLVGFQDPPTPKSSDSQAPDFVGPISFFDPETGEIALEFSGFGREIDLQQGSGLIQQARVKVYTKATEKDPISHTIHLFAARCNAEKLGRGEGAGQGLLRFSGGLRVFMDNDVRLGTSEGIFDVNTHILHCPNTTRLVHFTWPTKVDLASTMVYLDPQEMEWLQRFGAPAPDFELVGEEFELDAKTQVFTAGRKGRIRVTGRPGDSFGPPKKKPKRVSNDPTELSSEGPLRLENLGAPDPESWTTLRVTAERNVVVERLTKSGALRTRSDSASIYIGVPPKMEGNSEARPLSAVLKGGVRIEESGAFTATAERLEWNHQDDLLRLAGAPRVEVTHGQQRLLAREVSIDRWSRVVDFKGDIEATFLPVREGPATAAESALMTLKPGDLRMRTDSTGRPVAIHAWNGVKITTGGSAADEDALEVDGSAFEWDLITGEGAIRGAPFARIQEGLNIVVAPLVTFRGENFKQAYMVIKGPKHLKFFTESPPPDNAGWPLLDAALGLRGLRKRPDLREPTLNASASLLEAAFGLPGLQEIQGRRNSYMDLAASCDGDAILDQPANVVKLVDRCTVRAQDSTLIADRLFVFLIKGKGDRPSFDRVIGLGRVRASHDLGPGGGSIQIEGETLELKQNPRLGTNGERTVTVVGFPEGRGLLGESEEFQFVRLTFNLDTKTISMGPGWGRLGF